MPRSAGVVVQNNFTNGLVTEATALNFPENAVTDTLNCVFDERSIVSRRLGIDFETDYVEKITNSTGIVSTFLWQDVAGVGDLTFVVKQVGRYLYFYELPATGPVSSGLKGFTVNLEDRKTSGAPATTSIQAQFTFGNGFLFVSHPYCDPFYISYDPDADTITSTTISLEIRDFEGVDSGLEVTEHSSSLSAEHNYNLYNQGWNELRINRYYNAWSEYPADNEVWWLYKNSLDQYTFEVSGDVPAINRADRDRGTSPAPKGFFILDAFNQQRQGLAVVSSEYQRPSTIVFYSGRVFYSGVNYRAFNNKIYFSKTIEKEGDFGKAHQENDPTNEYTFDLLPTDGGVISIPEAGQIIKLFSIEGSLIVFATNGVWTITGSTGAGFQANDYSLKRISTVSTLTPSSFVDAGGLPVWWNADGIYTIEVNSTIGTIQVISLVDQKIKKFYNDIPSANKRFAKGEFDTLERTIQWMYRSTAAVSDAENYEYDSILCLNVLSGAFYPWRVSSNSVKLRDLVTVRGVGRTYFDTQIEDTNGDGIVDSLGVSVTVETSSDRQLDSVFKYLVSYVSGANVIYTWAEAKDNTYVDYLSFDATGTEYSSYFTTGFAIHGDAQRKFQVNYMYVYTKNDLTQSTFTIRTLWDYATSSDTNRWSAAQTITALPMPYSSDVRRIKMRGHGKACQFRVDSVAGEPFNILGWSLFETVNTGI